MQKYIKENYQKLEYFTLIESVNLWYSLGYGKSIIKIDNNKLIDIIKLKMILQIKL
jgi:hypothetical protein